MRTISRKSFRLARAVIRFGFGYHFIKPARFRVSFDMLIKKPLAKFIQPVADLINFFRMKFLNRAFDFCNRAHGENLIQHYRRCNGLFQDMTKSTAQHDGQLRAKRGNFLEPRSGDFWTDVLSHLQLESSKKAP